MSETGGVAEVTATAQIGPTPAEGAAGTGAAEGGTESHTGPAETFEASRERHQAESDRRRQELPESPRKERKKEQRRRAKEIQTRIEEINDRLAGGDRQQFRDELDTILREGAGEINDRAEREKALKKFDKAQARELAKEKLHLKFQKMQYNWFTLNFVVAPVRGAEALAGMVMNAGIYAYDLGAKYVEHRQEKSAYKGEKKENAKAHHEEGLLHILERQLEMQKEQDEMKALESGQDPEENRSTRSMMLEQQVHMLEGGIKSRKARAAELHKKARTLIKGRYQIDFVRSKNQFKKEEGHH